MVLHLGGALRMTVNDVRLAITCPNKPETIKRVIMRSNIESVGLGLAVAFSEDGANWPKQVCESESN